MEGNYPVLFGKETAGKVQVLRQGLYYRFVCRCRVNGDAVCRLTAVCGGNAENLGVLIPDGDGFSLDKKLPVKHFGSEEMTFFLTPRHEDAVGEFVPIYPEEPFSYIARLKDGFLARRNGQTGVVFQNQSDSSKPTGQWSEPMTSA